MTERPGARDLAVAIDRLTGLLAGASELDWPGVVHAACDEIEDLRGTRTLPSPLVRWVRDVIGRWPK
jgi:hypothetical protein